MSVAPTEAARRGPGIVATVRRPGHSVYDAIGTSDMTTDDVYYEPSDHGHEAVIAARFELRRREHQGDSDERD